MLESLIPYIAIAIGIVAILYAVLKSSDQNAILRQTGQKVEGIIFNRDYSTYDSNTKDKVTVRFVTDKLEWITADINQDFSFFYTGQYKPGDKLIVYYDKEDPNKFYVDTKQSEVIGRLIGIIVGFIFIAFGVYQFLNPSTTV
jgi:Protein of unknown function (DUF3592)